MRCGAKQKAGGDAYTRAVPGLSATAPLALDAETREDRDDDTDQRHESEDTSADSNRQRNLREQERHLVGERFENVSHFTSPLPRVAR